MREWTCQWQGLPLTVQNWTRWLRTGERLVVARSEVDANESWIWSRMSAYLAAPVSLRGIRHVVEATIGQGHGKLRTCCQIFVDGQLVGGDTDVTLALPDVRSWAKTREQGMVRFLFTRGLWRFGLPYAVAAAALSAAFARGRDIEAVVVQWAVAGILFGLVMGILHWRTGESIARLRRAKHDRPARSIG